MKTTIALILSMAVALVASAQTNLPPTFIKGSMNIKFDTALTDSPEVGIVDTYNLDVNMNNNVHFGGTITDRPLIMGGWSGGDVKQSRSLRYNLDCDLYYPNDKSRFMNVGTMSGVVPISQNGAYHYDNGSLKISVLPKGNAGGFDGPFKGVANGKPLVRPANWLDTLQNQMVNITRSVNGKTTTVHLTKYDKMVFNQVVLGKGPSMNYQDVTMNGEMLYDYDRNCWFFNDVKVQYEAGEQTKTDHITGTIRWMPDAHRAANGQGEYQFDLRINEPPPKENAAFVDNSSDESSFFQTDTTIPALTGTMKYNDKFKPGTTDPLKDPTGKNATTTASSVVIDLTGNNITKQQTMVLCKAIIFASVVPMNSD